MALSFAPFAGEQDNAKKDRFATVLHYNILPRECSRTSPKAKHFYFLRVIEIVAVRLVTCHWQLHKLNHTKISTQYDSLKARVTFQDSGTESFHPEMKASSSLMSMDAKISFRKYFNEGCKLVGRASSQTLWLSPQDKSCYACRLLALDDFYFTTNEVRIHDRCEVGWLPSAESPSSWNELFLAVACPFS